MTKLKQVRNLILYAWYLMWAGLPLIVGGILFGAILITFGYHFLRVLGGI